MERELVISEIFISHQPHLTDDMTNDAPSVFTSCLLGCSFYLVVPSSCRVNSQDAMLASTHVLFTFTFCWTSVKRMNTNHFSSQPSARPPQVWVWAFQCECENFVPFFLFFRSFKGKCLKHTNSQGQELKPHYGLAPPFSPGVSAWTSVWRSSLRQRYKCAVEALLAIYSVEGVKKTKEHMAGQQTHD